MASVGTKTQSLENFHAFPSQRSITGFCGSIHLWQTWLCLQAEMLLPMQPCLRNISPRSVQAKCSCPLLSRVGQVHKNNADAFEPEPGRLQIVVFCWLIKCISIEESQLGVFPWELAPSKTSASSKRLLNTIVLGARGTARGQ